LVLPEQPNLKRNVVYKCKSFPIAALKAAGSGLTAALVKYVYIFCIDSEKKLGRYARTGWEFTATGPVLAGLCSLGITALVTIPVSTTLLIVKRRCRRVATHKIVWPGSGSGSKGGRGGGAYGNYDDSVN
jgi:hypothetical protein